MTTRGTRQSRSLEDYELSKSLKAPTGDGDVSYHSAVHSIHGPPGTGQSRDEESGNDRAGGRQTSGTETSFDKNCYVTNEYEVSWEEKRRSVGRGL
jgi:hypothetical protein